MSFIRFFLVFPIIIIDRMATPSCSFTKVLVGLIFSQSKRHVCVIENVGLAPELSRFVFDSLALGGSIIGLFAETSSSTSSTPASSKTVSCRSASSSVSS